MMYPGKHLFSKSAVISLLFILYSNFTYADDIEIYLDQAKLAPEKVRSNVTFVLDSSGSMVLPIKDNISSARREKQFYNPQVEYPGKDNMRGGAGDPDYFYLYQRRLPINDAQNNYNRQEFMYFNKVHRSRLQCNNVGLYTDNRSKNSMFDYYRYANNRDWLTYRDRGRFRPMCAENNPGCGYVSGPSSAQVDCYSQGRNRLNRNFSYNERDRVYIMNANAHNYLQGYYRFTVLQTVMKDIIDKPVDVNLSLMKFDDKLRRGFPGGQGGYVIKEFVDNNVQRNRADAKQKIDSMQFLGSTPLTETLWEATQYMLGGRAKYGQKYNGGVNAAFSSGDRYKSPIVNVCPRNHIILLTDGTPTQDDGSDTDIQQRTGSNCSHQPPRNGDVEFSSQSCLDDLALWLGNDENNTPSKLRDHSPSLVGDQTITVHTIGFGINNELLKTTARNGNGFNQTASTADELTKAFETILTGINFQSDLFVAPAIPVDLSSGLNHREYMYFSLFQPNASPRWSGNVKKYRFDVEKNTIVGANNVDAIDQETGFFDDRSVSYWTLPAVDGDKDGEPDFTKDGSDIRIGGFATALTRRGEDPSARKVYTYTGAAPPNNFALKNETFTLDNTNITEQSLGITSDDVATRTDIINWTRREEQDLDNDPATPLVSNYFMADFLHNKASIVTYSTPSPEADGSINESKYVDTIFAGSNMGIFHAIDAKDGSELYSFVPKELFPNLTAYYKNMGGFFDKVYGLDAPMLVWRNDQNRDGNIVKSDNDSIYIYQAMRRGGTSIYALDVTDRNEPVLSWQIKGTALDGSTTTGGTAQPVTGDFANLAQTWSVPQRGKINQCGRNSGCTERDVLFFGGGYDPAYDDTNNSPADTSKGNAIYMVDARTGDLIWSAGKIGHDFNLQGMTNSIVADVRVADTSNDGYTNVVVAVDIRGKVWRFDFDNNTANAPSGGQIADLGGGSGSTFRRFYNTPDLAYFAPRGRPALLSVSVSSGYRAHPRNDQIKDSLFVFFDKNPILPPKDKNYKYAEDGSRIITVLDLGAPGDPEEFGWKFDFPGVGEKGLARTLTFADTILLTTYTPDNSATCLGSPGSGKVYFLDGLTGTQPVDNPPVDLKNSGIPPSPALLFLKEPCTGSACNTQTGGNNGNNNGAGSSSPELINARACVGTYCIKYPDKVKLQKTYWRENAGYRKASN